MNLDCESPTGFWYGYCQSGHFILLTDYQVTISAAGCIRLSLSSHFITPAFREYRAMTYISLGLFTMIFVVHGLFLNGFHVQRKRLGLEWMMLMALLNLLGAAVYSIRVCQEQNGAPTASTASERATSCSMFWCWLQPVFITRPWQMVFRRSVQYEWFANLAKSVRGKHSFLSHMS